GAVRRSPPARRPVVRQRPRRQRLPPGSRPGLAAPHRGRPSPPRLPGPTKPPPGGCPVPVPPSPPPRSPAAALSSRRRLPGKRRPGAGSALCGSGGPRSGERRGRGSGRRPLGAQGSAAPSPPSPSASCFRRWPRGGRAEPGREPGEGRGGDGGGGRGGERRLRERDGAEDVGAGQQHAGGAEHRRDLQVRPQAAAGDPGGQALDQGVGRLENAIGWYHSHPGYGCWLSGIDVSTQMLNQQFQEPFVAVVIDPTRTISAGKVNLGAFRTYPKGYKPPDEGPSEYQTIPLNKIEDFGVHCKQYYALEVSYFKSSLDRKLLELLWNKYWVNTLSSSSLLTNADYTTGQVFDLSEKLEQSEAQLGRGSFMLGLETHDKKSEDKLAKATRDSCKTTIEAIHGLMSQVIKDKLFNQINIA
uniref:COP9 signalosome complex subunit 5 n=1 Tax=Anas platyrhynchos platyrhynchos TaxID=8840 RepID=A0A493T2I0_ANAPP